jgi:curli biogenesis system outer membrane secretion channel CsgG
MFAAALLLAMVLQSASPAPPAKPATEKPRAAEVAQLSTKLMAVKRIYVDSFGEDAVSKQIQAMVVSSLVETKRFVVTENKEKADAILRGTALEKTSQELNSFSEGAAASTAGGGFSASTLSASGGFHAAGVAAEDKHANTETVNDARVAVRLVSPDGDVIWTTTQESKGAKYKGASADVADKVAKQLIRDLEKLEKAPSAQGQ